jgi:hypothetical protein
VEVFAVQPHDAGGINRDQARFRRDRLADGVENAPGDGIARAGIPIVGLAQHDGDGFEGHLGPLEDPRGLGQRQFDQGLGPDFRRAQGGITVAGGVNGEPDAKRRRRRRPESQRPYSAHPPKALFRNKKLGHPLDMSMPPVVGWAAVPIGGGPPLALCFSRISLTLRDVT